MSEKKKKPACPMCRNKLVAVCLATPMDIGSEAIGWKDEKGRERIQVRCVSCGAQMLMNPDLFKDTEEEDDD